MLSEGSIERSLKTISLSSMKTEMPVDLAFECTQFQTPEGSSMVDGSLGLRRNYVKALKTVTFAVALSVFAIGTTSIFAQDHKKRRPNILFILTDNQAPSTLGCYGNDEILTPNIDHLASQGIQFQNAFACNGMCSPTRASIMTGLIPSQHGVHTQLSDQLQKDWPENWCAINEFRTLPQTLSDAGYQTALIGKYHLGIPFKPHLKFDYWLTFPVGHTWDWYNNEIIDNGERYKHPGHITDFWTEKAVAYIDNYKSNKPFFIYLAYDAPYGLPPSIYGQAKNRFAKLYANKDMKSCPRMAVNRMLLDYVKEAPKHYDVGYSKWLTTLIYTLNDIESMRNYASQITLVDDGIGKVLDALKRNGMDKDTLVILSSDQGLAYGQKGFLGQTENSLPSNLYDPLVQVPLIFRHIDHIPALRKLDLLVSDYDLFPTILDYIGFGNINIANSPGRSFAALLKGKGLEWQNRDAIFMEQEQSRAIRTSEWKYVKRFPKVQKKQPTKEEEDGLAKLKQYSNFETIEQLFNPSPVDEELYNVKKDPDEMVNLTDDPNYKDIKQALEKRLDAFFNQYADPKYDLWKGGTVKSNSNVEYIWKQQWKNWKPITEKVEHPFKEK